jgi:hypothetical protein
MGVASGLELLSSTGVAHEIEPTIEKLNELESICKLQDWASATSNDVWSRLARVKKLTSAISEAVARINSFVSIGRDFLDGVNMSRIVRWINHPNGEFEGRGKLTLEDRRLVYEGNDGSFGVVPLPDASRLRHVPTPVRAVQLVTEMTR